MAFAACTCASSPPLNQVQSPGLSIPRAPSLRSKGLGLIYALHAWLRDGGKRQAKNRDIQLE